MKYNLKYNLSLPFWKLEPKELMADLELRHEFTNDKTSVALDTAYFGVLSPNTLMSDCSTVQV